MSKTMCSPLPTKVKSAEITRPATTSTFVAKPAYRVSQACRSWLAATNAQAKRTTLASVRPISALVMTQLRISRGIRQLPLSAQRLAARRASQTSPAQTAMTAATASLRMKPVSRDCINAWYAGTPGSWCRASAPRPVPMMTQRRTCSSEAASAKASAGRAPRSRLARASRIARIHTPNVMSARTAITVNAR